MQNSIPGLLHLVSARNVRIRAWFQRRWPFLRERIHQYALLARVDHPIGAFLLLWPTLWALWIAAEGVPPLHLLLVFVLGVFLTRSAGCVLNDLADRRYDPHVQRTRSRPLVTGRVGGGEAFALASILLGLAFLLVLTTNRLTVLLSFVAIPLAVIYPYMKRYTYVPQFFLGLAFSWGIPMAFAAQSNSVPQMAWILFIANILWVVVFDSIYAMVDREDDLRIGIKSTAILFDDADRHIIGIIQGMFIVVLIILGRQLELGMFFNCALLAAVALIVYHQILIRKRAREDCFRAFLSNNWLGLIIFVGIALDYHFD
ncbi:MAG: 4-hydroxybenzoate octaprenyltransferase [Gammaproteobacteria bacterium]